MLKGKIPIVRTKIIFKKKPLGNVATTILPKNHTTKLKKKGMLKNFLCGSKVTQKNIVYFFWDPLNRPKTQSRKKKNIENKSYKKKKIKIKIVIVIDLLKYYI